MGEVWAAEQSGDLGFRRLVAIKVIRGDRGDDAAMLRMFLEEARLASRIHHANVIETIDLGEEQGLVYQVMALVDGAPLSSMLEPDRGRARSTLPAGVATRIVGDVLRGLHAAHELKDDDGVPLHLVHRDVSTHNVLVGTDGVARLADFGIAKAFGRTSDESGIGEVKGKVDYMAPEQAFGLPPTRRSDLFAAAAVLWEALAGEPLFSLPNDERGIVSRRKLEPRPLGSVAPAVPPAIAAVVMRALVRRPEERFASALEMGDALEEAVRVSGLEPATHQDVARGLEERLGASLAQRRDSIRAARRGQAGGARASLPSVSEQEDAAELVANELPTLVDPLAPTLVDDEAPTLAAPPTPPAEPVRAARGRGVVPLLVGGVAILAGAVWLLGARPPPPAPADVGRAAEVDVPRPPDPREPEPPPPPRAAQAESTVAAAASSPEAPALPLPPLRRAPSAARPARAPAPPAPSSAPKPRFDNPYE